MHDFFKHFGLGAEEDLDDDDELIGFSRKHQQAVATSTSNVNIWDGSARSGKDVHVEDPAIDSRHCTQGVRSDLALQQKTATRSTGTCSIRSKRTRP